MIARALIIEQLRPLLQSGSSKDRIHRLWAGVKFSRGTIAKAAFLQLAIDINLIDGRGYWAADIAEHRRPYGRQDVEHVIRWGLRGWNPFETGPLT